MTEATETREVWKCPDCGNIQDDEDDCQSCSYGEEEEGWTIVTIREYPDGDWEEL